MLVNDAPELLLRLSLSGTAAGKRVIHVTGDARYFPYFAERGGGGAHGKGAPIELSAWLEATPETTRHYFERCLDLYAYMCEGRNLRNTPAMRLQLPYELAMAIITDDAYDLQLRTRLVRVVRELYVDAEPHEAYVHVRLLRTWVHVTQETGRARAITAAGTPVAASLSMRASSARAGEGGQADDYALQARAVPSAGGGGIPAIDYAKFDDLYGFVQHFLRPYFHNELGQRATEVDRNRMVAQLVQVLYHLIRMFCRSSIPGLLRVAAPLACLAHLVFECRVWTGGGFVAYKKLPGLVRRMLMMLDGSNDAVGLEGSKPEDRYTRKRTVKTATRQACDTVVIMEAKLWLCHCLQLVCTVRLDLRLSLLLDQYRAEFEAGVWSGGEHHAVLEEVFSSGVAQGERLVTNVFRWLSPSARAPGSDEHAKRELKRAAAASKKQASPQQLVSASIDEAGRSAGSSTRNLLSRVPTRGLKMAVTQVEPADSPGGAATSNASQSPWRTSTYIAGGAGSGRFSAACGGGDQPHEAMQRSGQLVSGVELGGSTPSPGPGRGVSSLPSIAQEGAEGQPPADTVAPVSMGPGLVGGVAMRMADVNMLWESPAARAIRARRERPSEIARVLRFDFGHEIDVVGILTDLTRYELGELAAQAVALLVRQYEQTTTLVQHARQLQLLVRPAMVHSHAWCDTRTRQLHRLAARRRLYDHEMYEAAWLMGELSLTCYADDESDGAYADDRSVAPSQTSGRGTREMLQRRNTHGSIGTQRSRASGAGRSQFSATPTSLELNGGARKCLALVGRATVEGGSDRIVFLELGLANATAASDAPAVATDSASGGGGGVGGGVGGSAYTDATGLVRVHASLWIGGEQYRVMSVSTQSVEDGTGRRTAPRTVVKLDRAYAGASVHSEWVQAERRVSRPNHDMQLLLSKLGASAAALKLLQLPFETTRVLPHEQKLRAMICASYRLLRAMCNDFGLLQTELAQHLDTFVGHTEAALVEDDISPTQCIIAVCEGNREACTQVTPTMVRFFAELAGSSSKPRYLRFLRTIMAPGGGTVIARNQHLVVSALMGVAPALLLFNDVGGRAERDTLVARNDLERHPRGRLAYHIELIALLGSVAASDDESLKALVRDVLPLRDLLGHLTETPLSFEMLASGAPEAAGGASEQVAEASGSRQAAGGGGAQPNAPASAVLAAMLTLRTQYLVVLLNAYVTSSPRVHMAPLHEQAGVDGFPKLLRTMATVVRSFVERWLGEDSVESFTDDEDAIRAIVFVDSIALPVTADLFASDHFAGRSADALFGPSGSGGRVGSGRGAAAREATAELVSALADYVAAAQQNPALSAVRTCHRILRAATQLGVATEAALEAIGTAVADPLGMAGNDDDGSVPEQRASGLTSSLLSTDIGSGGISAASVKLADLPGAPLGGAFAEADSNGVAAGGGSKGKPQPQDVLLDFIARFEGHLGSEREFDALVHVFMDDFERVPANASDVQAVAALGSGEGRQQHSQHPQHPQHARRAGPRGARAGSRLSYLILNIERSRLPEDTIADEEQLAHVLASLRVLEKILSMRDFHPSGRGGGRAAEAETERELRLRQRLLVDLGAARVCVMMICSEAPAVCEMGLKVAIGLLRHGNPRSQAAFYELVADPMRADSVAAYDGGRQSFFHKMRAHLRLALSEIREAKIHREQQAERRAAFAEQAAAHEWSDATKAAMLAEIERPFAERSMVLNVLELLRLLCEGHNSQVQDLLREQSSVTSGASIDLVTEIAAYLGALEPEIDAHNVVHVIQCLETLTELCQGNVSMGNTRLLADGKVIYIAERLLLLRELRDVAEARLCRLRERAVTLLMAMLEGADRTAERVMLRRLNIAALARMLEHLYAKSAKANEGAAAVNGGASTRRALSSRRRRRRGLAAAAEDVPAPSSATDRVGGSSGGDDVGGKDAENKMDDGAPGRGRRPSSPSVAGAARGVKQGVQLASLGVRQGVGLSVGLASSGVRGGVQLAKATKQAAKHGLALADEDAALASEDGYGLYILLRHLCDFEEQEFTRGSELDASRLGSAASGGGTSSGGGKWVGGGTSVSGGDTGGALLGGVGAYEGRQWQVRETLKDARLRDALAFYARLTGSCEIVNANGDLERVFFRFPELCLSLTDARKTQLEWAVDRETPGAQLLQFIEAADELHAEMVHGHALEDWWLWRLVKQHVSKADNSLFTLALATNVALIWRAQYCVDQHGEPLAWSDTFCSRPAQRAVQAEAMMLHEVPINDTYTHVAFNGTEVLGFFSVRGGGSPFEMDLALTLQTSIFVLGILNCQASVLVFVLDGLRAGGPRVRRLVLRYVQRHALLRHVGTFDEIVAHVHDDLNWLHTLWFYPLCAGCFLANMHLLFLVFSLIAAILGLCGYPIWFAFGLLDFASKSPEIRIVAAALLQNLRALLMTFVFVIIVVYIYASVGYYSLADKFLYMDFREEAVPICASLLQCFVASTVDGLRNNDLGAAIERMPAPEISLYAAWEVLLYYLQAVYSLSYWFLVCIILLNVIFGIIIVCYR